MKILRVSARAAGWISAAYAGLLLVSLAWTLPGLIAKNSAQKKDVSVLLALDAESLDAIHGWPVVAAVPCTHIVLDASASASQEAAIRAMDKNILWNISDNVIPAQLLPRVRPSDLALLTDGALDHPQIYLNLPARLSDGGASAPEFDRIPSLSGWASRFSVAVVKTHVLGTREMLQPNPEAWRSRLCRAVEERWVRCLVVHMSPALSLPDNIRFLNGTVSALRARGFIVENRVRRLSWLLAPLSSGARWATVLFVSIATPLLILYWARRLKRGAMFMFAVASGVSVATGLLIHALGATPAFVLGLEPLRGLKVQLGGALLIALPFLFSIDDFRSVLRQSITSRAVAVWLVAGIIVLALYWMRSGNHPLLPVSDTERGLRGALEKLFVARPRFKEFLFGHPLFFLGLSLTRRPFAGRWWGDGRIFLWLGLVGQISILNTFTHFHTPLSYCVLRTIYGLCLGLALAMGARRLLQLTQ